MIVRIKNKTILADVPHKCGKSTVLNLLSYAVTGTVLPKMQIKKRLGDVILYPGDDWQWYQQNPMPLDYRFAVVRDPVDRALSVWADRVIRKKQIELEDRSWNYFVKHFETLKQHPDIELHTRPQHTYINPDLNFYDGIFNVRKLSTDVRKALNKLLDTDCPLVRANQSRYESNLSTHPTVTLEQRKFFEDYYSRDYELFGSIF